MSARPLASALRDACKKIMIERQQKQKRPTTLPTAVRTRGTPSNPSAFFPTPMDEPRKVIKAFYLGSTTVLKPTGMDTLNSAIGEINLLCLNRCVLWWEAFMMISILCQIP